MQAANFCFSALAGLLVACILACLANSRCENFEFKRRKVLFEVHSLAFGGRGIFITTKDLSSCRIRGPKFLDRSQFPYPDDDDIRGSVDAFQNFAANYDRKHLQVREQFLRCKQTKSVCHYPVNDKRVEFHPFL